LFPLEDEITDFVRKLGGQMINCNCQCAIADFWICFIYDSGL